MQAEAVTAADGQRIAASFFVPPAPRGAVLIVPAMGVPQPYYRPFAEWLSREGFAAATFDYRGTGLSRPDRMRGYQADIVDWARLDCAAMIDALAARAPGAPLYWVGHSLGGQILAFVPNLARVARAVTIATGSGYWRETQPRIRLPGLWLWLIAPLAVRLWGYFPGATLRKVGDVPGGVMLQWRRWCLQREYAVGDGEHVRALYAAVRTPIASLSFTDDELMSARNTESIHGFYVNAPRTMKRIAAREVGARRIGHFGFFRAAFEQSLWRGQLLPLLH